MKLFGRKSTEKNNSKNLTESNKFQSEELLTHQVRKIDVNEIKTVMKISQNTLSERYSHDLMMEIYQSWPDGFLVYESAGKIYGFLAGRKMTQSDARVLMLATEEDYRSRGIGGELLDNFVNTCQVYGFINIRLEVRTDNSRGISFYQKHGFMVTSILRNYYSDFTDAYVMWKQLV